MQGVSALGNLANGNLVGPAFTLRNIPSREDLDVLDVFLDPENPQRKAIETAPPGSVLVQDCRGDKTVASSGSILTTRLKIRGVAGMVSDGPVRDSGAIIALGFPVFCAGASAPTNLIKHHPVDLNVPDRLWRSRRLSRRHHRWRRRWSRRSAAPFGRGSCNRTAAEQELMEEFITSRSRRRSSGLRGTYPPNAETKEAYMAWKRRS